MKKRFLGLMLTLIMLLSAGAFVFSAYAEEGPKVLTVNTANIAGGYGMGAGVKFDSSVSLPSDYWQALKTDNIEIYDRYGNVVEVQAFETVGSETAVNRGKRLFSVNDVLVFKTGFKIEKVDGTFTGTAVFTQDNIFQYQTVGSPWVRLTELPEFEEEPDEPPAPVDLSVVSVNYVSNWGVPSIMINFGTSTAQGFDMYQNFDVTGLSFVTGFGEEKEIHHAISVGTGHVLVRIEGATAETVYTPVAGDVFTVGEGFTLHPNETMPEDVSYIINLIDKPVIPYSEAAIPTSLEASVLQEFVAVGATLKVQTTLPQGTYGTPRFSSSDTEKATVNASGTVLGVAEGTVTITAYLSDTIKQEVEIEVIPAKEIVGLELVGTYTYWIEKDAEFNLSEKVTKAQYVFDDGSFSPEFDLEEDSLTYTVDTSVVNSTPLSVPVTVEFGEETYETEVLVRVYELYPQEISQVGIVDWFAYHVFVQFPNTSTNKGNITSGSMIPGIRDYVSYTRADGTEVAISGFYMLNENLAVMLSFKDEEGNSAKLDASNYNDYYQVGDIFTFEAGLPIYKWTGQLNPTPTDNGALALGTGESVVEGRLLQTVQYRYNGDIWGLYIEYDDIEVTNETLEVRIGDNRTTGVRRVPNNATTGTFTYVSSDTSVAAVSTNGIISGVGAGTATITVTLDGGTAGEKTVTLTVNVTDYVTGLEFTPASVNSNRGKELDLSDITAKLKFASGQYGEEVDLTNATITGFNKDETGEQNVVVSVTVDGETYSGVLVVTVTARGGGCNGNTVPFALGLSLLVAAAVVMLSRSKKQAN